MANPDPKERLIELGSEQEEFESKLHIAPPEKVPGLEEFVEKYIPSKLPMNWHHRLFYDILSNKVIQKEDGKLYYNTFKDKNGVYVPYKKFDTATPDKINNNILLMAPRFHAKSQSITINYVLWQIYKNPNIRIIIVSANEDIAISFNRAVMNHLENNMDLIDGLGNRVPEFADKKKWGEKAIIVKRDTLEKDPTIAAIGLGGGLISRRADIIICDDLIDINSARTKQARSKTKEWFENVLLPILEDDGRLIVAGTAWYKDDIYDTLWKDSQFDIRLKLKALIYDDRYYRERGIKSTMRNLPYDVMDFPMAQKAQDIFSQEILDHYTLYQQLKGGVLWQAKWSYDKLMKKKENMAESAFNRQYLNEPSSDEEKTFKANAIKKSTDLGTHKSLVPAWDNSNPVVPAYGHLIVAIGVDLAISKKDTADQSAIAVWGLDERRRRILLWADFGRWSPDEIKQRVVEAYYNFRAVKIRVENIAYQDMMRQAIADDDVPVEGFHTTAGKKYNEETGIAHVAMLAEQEKLLIPSSRVNKTYWDRVRQLLYEMSVYTYDQHAGDVLMASWFALNALNEFDRRMRDNRGYFSAVAIIDSLKNIKAAHRVVLLGTNPPVFRFAANSLVYIFRPVDHPGIADSEPFIDPEERFMIFATRQEKSIAYIINKVTNEIVGKIEGDLTALMFVNLLERAGGFFNKAQIVVDRNNEGEAVYLELQQRYYPKLLVLQPDERGIPRIGPGFKITSGNLPLSIDHFKMMVENGSIKVPDDGLIKEMGDIIGVEGDKLNMSFGAGQRLRTVAAAIWLLDNYENGDKKLYNGSQSGMKKRKSKELKVPYRVFQKNYGRT